MYIFNKSLWYLVNCVRQLHEITRWQLTRSKTRPICKYMCQCVCVSLRFLYFHFEVQSSLPIVLQLTRFGLNVSFLPILGWMIFCLLFPSFPGGSDEKRPLAGWRSPWRHHEAALRFSEWHTAADTQSKVVVGVSVKVITCHPSLLQTLEGAFLRLCETSDHVACKQEPSPQGGGPLENSQSFESGRDESRPILTVGAGFAEDVPKYTGTVLE